MIDTLIFSGGGIKGIGFIGCIQALIDKGMLKKDNIKTLIGTSAGSIIATFIAIGYEAKEINDLVLELNFAIFQDITIDNVMNFFQTFGIDSGNELERIIEIIIKKKQKKNLTFRELYEKNGIRLIINAVCLNDECVEYFSYENYPDLIISKAIRMSCSIPLVYKPVVFNNKLYVDGGVLDNLSLEKAGKNFLAFYITIKDEQRKLNSLDMFLYALFTSINRQLNLDKFLKNKKNIVCLNISCVSCVNFNLDKSTKQKMITDCYNSTIHFLVNDNRFIEQDKQDIEQNTQDIEQNTQEIKQEIEQNIQEIKQEIEQNTQDIEQNTQDIEQNTQDIDQNTQDIDQNTQDIDQKTQDIDQNTQDIDQNTQDIDQKTQEIKKYN